MTTASDAALCGCGRPRDKYHGRCWYVREHPKGKKHLIANGGGQALTSAKTKRAYTKRAPASKPALAASTPVIAASELSPEPAHTCEFSIRIQGPGYDMNFTGTSLDGLKRVLEKF